MNWKKGLFRLWVIASFLWLIGVLMTSVGSWPAYSEHKYYAWNTKSGEFQAVHWRDVYEVEKAITAGQYTAVENPEGFSVVFGANVDRERMKAVVPQVRATIERERPLRMGSHLAATAGFAVIPPIVVLLCGLALAWIVRGFRG